MKTLKVDAYQRVRLPHVKPLQVLAYEQDAGGTITLKPVKTETSEAFPRGSLLKFITPEWNKLHAALSDACIQGR